jgi:hypothetical protein
MAATNLIHIPISTSRKLVREQTFRIIQSRDDFTDAIGQCTILHQQLHDSKFTGQVIFNYSQGTIGNVTSIDGKKVDPQ